MPDLALAPLHLTPADYHVIGPEQFGAPGLTARESIGPFVAVQALGPLVTVHDSRFEAHRGIGHHPHQRMERLFYILQGTVDHDDALNHITGHMGTGDLGILTEGARGMIHSEWNNSDGDARAYILVYPTDPTPATASFDAVRDPEAPRVEPAPGVVTKHVIGRDAGRLHGDVRAIADSAVAQGALLEILVGRHEAALLFVVDGHVQLQADDGTTARVDLRREHTVLLPPAAHPRTVVLSASKPSRVLHAVTGPGLGVRRRES